MQRLTCSRSTVPIKRLIVSYLPNTNKAATGRSWPDAGNGERPLPGSLISLRISSTKVATAARQGAA